MALMLSQALGGVVVVVEALDAERVVPLDHGVDHVDAPVLEPSRDLGSAHLVPHELANELLRPCGVQLEVAA